LQQQNYGQPAPQQSYGGYDPAAATAAATSGGPGGYGAPPQGGGGAQWQALDDGQGRTYYYNTASGVSQWEKPPGM